MGLGHPDRLIRIRALLLITQDCPDAAGTRRLCRSAAGFTDEPRVWGGRGIVQAGAGGTVC